MNFLSQEITPELNSSHEAEASLASHKLQIIHFDGESLFNIHETNSKN